MQQPSPHAFWTLVFLGFLFVVITFYIQKPTLESFADTQTATPTTTTDVPNTTGPASGTATEQATGITTGAAATGTTNTAAASTTVSTTTIAKIPQMDKLSLYLSSFMSPSSYQCESNYWCDSIRQSTKFFLMANTLPLAIYPSSGLPIHMVSVRGPPAYTLALEEKQYKMESFTISFYMQINDIVFDPTVYKDVVILNIPAQTPDRVKIYFKPVDENPQQVMLCVKLGNILTNDIFTWTFDKATLSGGNRLFSFVYDKDNNKLKFYMGKDENSDVKEVSPNTSITLSVSEMIINENLNLNANLIAFFYFMAPLAPSEIQNLNTYCVQYSTGYASQVIANAELSDQLKNLMSKLQKQAQTVANLKDRLSNATCGDSAASSAYSVPKKWQISIDGNDSSDVSTNDMNKCSPLTVKKFGASVAPTDENTNEDGGELTTEYPEVKKTRFKIPYPPNVTDKTVPKNPNPTPTPTPTTNPTSSSGGNSTTSTTTSTTTDTDFWRNFFSFLQNKNTADTTTSSSSNISNLNELYDKLRGDTSNVDTTDTPATPEAPTAPAPKASQESWWRSMRDIFME